MVVVVVVVVVIVVRSSVRSISLYKGHPLYSLHAKNMCGIARCTEVYAELAEARRSREKEPTD